MGEAGDAIIFYFILSHEIVEFWDILHNFGRKNVYSASTPNFSWTTRNKKK